MIEKEIEIKVLNHSVNEYIEMLEKIGASKVGEEYQKNYLINSNLDYNKSYIRLRVLDDRAEFTLKERMDEDNFRINKETTTTVDDPESLLYILKALGFDYKLECKHRIKYAFKDYIFDIDQWAEDVYPIPYMEIEARDASKLDDIIDLLNIRSDITTKTIHQLKEEYKNSK